MISTIQHPWVNILHLNCPIMNQGDLLLEDNHEGSTPLDLLLNAISGGNQYTFSENGPGDLTTEESLGGLLASDSFLTREDEEAVGLLLTPKLI